MKFQLQMFNLTIILCIFLASEFQFLIFLLCPPFLGFAELAADLVEAAVAHCQLIVVSK